jgi:peptidoglycan hydrolase-like protein with peptidoglycan-binding domain
MFCTDPDTCTLDGVCRGVAKPPQDTAFQGVALQGQLRGLTNFIQILVDDGFPGTGLTFSATVGASGSTMNVCCETKKSFVPNTNATYTASGGLSTQQVFLPDLSIPFGTTGGGIGVSANFNLQLQGQISLNDAKCQDYKCAQGSFTVGGGVQLNGGGLAIDPVTHMTVAQLQLQAMVQLQVQIQNSGDCKSIDGTFGIAPVSATVQEQFPFGLPVTIPIGTIFGGITLAGQSVSLQ